MIDLATLIPPAVTAMQSASLAVELPPPVVRVGTDTSRLVDLLPDLPPGVHAHLVTRSTIQLQDWLAHVADRMGPLNVTYANFGLAEDNIDGLADLHARGLVRSCAALLDHQVRTKRHDAQARLPWAQLRLGHCHAKVFCLSSGTRRLTLSGSANLLPRTMLEIMQATDDVRVYDFHRAWIADAFSRGVPFERRTL